MATANKNVKSIPRRATTPPPPAAAPVAAPAAPVAAPDVPPLPDELVDANGPQKQQLQPKPVVDDDMVTVVNAKQFMLTVAHGHEVVIPAGTQELPRSYAEHWYSKAQGLVVYEPKKK